MGTRGIAIRSNVPHTGNCFHMKETRLARHTKKSKWCFCFSKLHTDSLWNSQYNTALIHLVTDLQWAYPPNITVISSRAPILLHTTQSTTAITAAALRVNLLTVKQ
jgi:hypothetical protein